MVTEGMVKRDKFLRIYRKSKEIAKGKIADIKRFKDDVAEVRAGYECGITFEKFQDIKEGDVVECYVMEEVER